MVQDLATRWVQSYPCKTRTSQETGKFLEPSEKPKVIYTDNTLEFGKSCEDLSWNHCTSTLHRSETNGIAERAVRRIKEGTSARAWVKNGGLVPWTVTVICEMSKTFWSRGKHGMYERRGLVIPIGSKVEFLPISREDQSRFHQLGMKVSPAIFLGYASYVEGVWRILDASEIHARRLNGQEIITPISGRNFIFPFADGTAKSSGGEYGIHFNAGPTRRKRRSQW